MLIKYCHPTVKLGGGFLFVSCNLRKIDKVLQAFNRIKAFNIIEQAHTCGYKRIHLHRHKTTKYICFYVINCFLLTDSINTHYIYNRPI